MMIFYRFPFTQNKDNNIIMEIKKYTYQKSFSIDELLGKSKKQSIIDKLKRLSPEMKDFF